MAERSFNIVLDATYDAKTERPTPVSIDDDVNRVTVSIDRTDWTQSHRDPLIKWVMFMSINGRGFTQTAASGTHGGIKIGDGGNPITASWWTFDLPKGRNRQFKFDVEIARRTRVRVDADTLIRVKR